MAQGLVSLSRPERNIEINIPIWIGAVKIRGLARCAKSARTVQDLTPISLQDVTPISRAQTIDPCAPDQVPCKLASPELPSYISAVNAVRVDVMAPATRPLITPY